MMDKNTRRTVLTAVVAVLVVSVMSIAGVGLAAAQPSDRGGDGGGDAAPSDGGGGMPSLPGAASDVAKDVLGTVGEFLSGGLDALGEALRGVTPGGEGGE